MRRGFIIQVDFTYRCNLRCKHCYFYNWQENKCELGDAEMLAFLRALRAEHDPRICIFLGGEPLLRRELLLKAVELFPVSWVATNGTLPLPDFPDNVVLFVSLDGPKEVNDAIRGQGVYRRVKENLKDYEGPFIITSVLNRLNWRDFPRLVEEWPGVPFYVSLHTPSKALGPRDPFVLVGRERDECIDMLTKLWEETGQIIATRAMLESMRHGIPDGPEGCPVHKYLPCYDPCGHLKPTCTMHEADCSLCGLHCAHLLRALEMGDGETLALVQRFLEVELAQRPNSFAT